MGAFFTNIQLYCGKADKKKMRSRVAEAIREFIEPLGFEETEGKAEVDLVVAVGPVTRHPWISVYDQGTEDQDTKKMAALLAFLTKKLSCSGVGVTVHDSDVLFLMLCENGNQVDSHDSDPTYFGHELNPEEEAMAKGHPERWRTLVKPKSSVEELAKYFNRKRDAFIEDSLGTELAVILDWHPEHCRVGYNYLSELDTSHFLKLQFSLKDKITSEEICEGKPMLHWAGFNNIVAGIAGQPFSCHLSFLNNGGASTGLGVMLWGPAVNTGLMNTAGLRVKTWRIKRRDDGATEANEQNEGELVPGRGTNEEKLLVGRLPDVPIPVGLKSPSDRPAYGQHDNDFQRQFDLTVSVSITGTLAGEGDAQLHIALVPLDNRETGAATFSVKMNVIAPPRLPLRAQSPEDDESSVIFQGQLRALSVRRTLFAMAVFERLDEYRAERMRSIIADWIGFIRDQTVSTYLKLNVITQKDDELDHFSIPLENFAESEKWRTALTPLASPYTLLAQIPPLAGKAAGPIDMREKWKTSGALHSHRRKLMPYIDNGAESGAEAVSLCLWADLKTLKDESGARRLLESLMREIMIADRGLQAFVTAWDYAPGLFQVETTPYESVCGLDRSDHMLSLAWCERFVRAVSETMWLGPSLRRLLSDESLLKQCAEVMVEGEVLSLRLKSDHTLTELEKCLEPILPVPGKR